MGITAVPNDDGTLEVTRDGVTRDYTLDEVEAADGPFTASERAFLRPVFLDARPPGPSRKLVYGTVPPAWRDDG